MNALLQNMSIGVFDSGIGGLSIVKEIIDVLPNEDIVYFGDTARLPYGSKTEETVKKICIENGHFLLSKGVKLIIIACNTASAVALESMRNYFNLPIIGVVESGAIGAVKATRNKRIGVIGTKTTIHSRAYSNAIKGLDPNIDVFELATPLLVHLVEEDWVEKEVTLTILDEYLGPLLSKGIDTLVLGCTHYPFLKSRIHSMAPNIYLIDSNREIALLLRNLLQEKKMGADPFALGGVHFYFSDIHPDFEKWTKQFLGKEILVRPVNFKHFEAQWN